MADVPADRCGHGGVRTVLRGIRLRPRGLCGGEDRAGRLPGRRGDGNGRRQDRGQEPAARGRRPAEIPAGSPALRWNGIRVGSERASHASSERLRPSPSVRQAAREEHPFGLRGSRPCGIGSSPRDSAGCARGRPLAGRDRLRACRADAWTEALLRGTPCVREPRRGRPPGCDGPQAPRSEPEALLRYGVAGGGRTHLLLPAAVGRVAVPDLLLGGHVGAGGSVHHRRSPASPSPAHRRGRTLRPAGRLPGLESRSRQRRGRTGL